MVRTTCGGGAFGGDRSGENALKPWLPPKYKHAVGASIVRIDVELFVLQPVHFMEKLERCELRGSNRASPLFVLSQSAISRSDSMPYTT